MCPLYAPASEVPDHPRHPQTIPKPPQTTPTKTNRNKPRPRQTTPDEQTTRYHPIAFQTAPSHAEARPPQTTLKHVANELRPPQTAPKHTKTGPDHPRPSQIIPDHRRNEPGPPQTTPNHSNPPQTTLQHVETSPDCLYCLYFTLGLENSPFNHTL